MSFLSQSKTQCKLVYIQYGLYVLWWLAESIFLSSQAVNQQRVSFTASLISCFSYHFPPSFTLSLFLWQETLIALQQQHSNTTSPAPTQKPSSLKETAGKVVLLYKHKKQKKQQSWKGGKKPILETQNISRHQTCGVCFVHPEYQILKTTKIWELLNLSSNHK